METFVVRVSPARHGFRSVLLLLALLFVATSVPFLAQTPDPERLWVGGTTLLSRTVLGTAPSEVSTAAANSMSADGRYVVFTSPSPQIVSNDTNTVTDVFLRDRQLNLTTRVSVSTNVGNQANGPSAHASISADGRFVSFASLATNLGPGDTNGFWDVYVHDRVTRTTTLVSRSQTGAPGNGDSTVSAISADGRHVVFASNATNLTGTSVPPGQLYLRDRDMDADGIFDELGGASTTTLISKDNFGPLPNGPVTGTFDITPDGRYVAYASDATNVVCCDGNGVTDVFVYDRVVRSQRRVSVTSYGSETVWIPGASRNPQITPDGRFVVFESAGMLDLEDFDNAVDIMLHDLQTSETTRVNFPGGGPFGPHTSVWPSISDDARYVAFESGAPNQGMDSYDDVYVVDRQTGYTFLINQDPFGSRMVPMATRPSISGDGSTVVFHHGGVDGTVKNVYAAVDFSIAPTMLEFDPLGTEQTVSVTAPPTTGWRVTPDQGQGWIMPIDGTDRAGTGTLRVKLARNTSSSPRSGTLKIGPHSVSIWQAPGMQLHYISPSSGNGSGGNTMEIYGDGFLAGATVLIGGVNAPVLNITWNQITVVTPAHAAGVVHVEVINGNGDRRALANAYTYLDSTPPVIEPIVTGTLGNNGWYTSNVTLTWSITDAESAVTSTSGCETVTQVYDTYEPTPITCSATSQGGTASASYTIKRDTSKPYLYVVRPLWTIYKPGESVTASYMCNDSSGLESCVGTVPDMGALDTSTPGYREFTVDGKDLAGLQNSLSVTYAVSTGVCSALPADVVSWWKGDGNTNDLIGANRVIAINGPYGVGYASYGTGMVGPYGNSAFKFKTNSGATSINFGSDPSLTMTDAFTISAWIDSTNPVYNEGVAIKKSGEYGLAIASNRLAYYFGSASHTSTGFYIRQNTWTHVAMTYDAGVLTIYANGRVVATENVAPTLVDALPDHNDFMIGGSQDVAPGGIKGFDGLIDEVQVYRRALTSTEMEAMFLSGAAGNCKPPATTLTVPPVSTTYQLAGGITLTPLTAQLTSAGAGVAGRTITFTLADATVGTAVTDSNGNASVQVNLAGMQAGDYAIRATHIGDPTIQGASANGSLRIAKATSVITWPTPEPVVYGATMSAAQMTATAAVPGTFTYSPEIGTRFNADLHVLSVSFVPDDSTNFTNATKIVVLEVKRATPTLTVDAGTYTYDKKAHPATWLARGIDNETLPVTVTYNGSTTPPVNVGSYTVVATVNAPKYEVTSKTASTPLVITQATPTVTVNARTFVYDGAEHQATASARGVDNEVLTPVTLTYNGSSATPIDAGTYTVVGAYAGNQNYAAVSATGATPLTIAQATPTATFTTGTFVYDAVPHAATVTVKGVGGVELTPIAITYNGDPNAPTNAGTYAVVASFEGSLNYTAVNLTAPAPLTIAKATPVVVVYPSSRNYDGSPIVAPHKATGVNGEELTPVELTYNGSPTTPIDAGQYTVIATYAGSQNYNAATSYPAGFTIQKRTPVMWVSEVGSATYDGAPHGSTVSLKGINGEELSPYTITYNGESATPVNAGSYNVAASFPGNTNYEPRTVTSWTPLVIGKATPTVQIAGNPSVPYDGNPHALTATATGVGGTELTPVTITYNGETAAPVAAGSYTVVASYAGSANYNAASKTGALAIGKVQPTVSWAPAPAVYGTPIGAAQNNASASVPGTWTYTRPAGTMLRAGSYLAEASFTPADAQNYNTASATATIVITPAPLTAMAVDQVKMFGAPVPVLTINYVGLVNGDTPGMMASVLGLTTTATATSPIGTYPIGPVWGVANPDYTVTFVPGVLTVQPAATSVTVTSSANPSGVNQPITLTASVAVVAPGAGQPTGTLTFSNGSTVLGTATMENGTASLTTGLSTGSHVITVAYSGETSFAASQGALTQTVNPSSTSTTTTVTSSLNPSKSGQAVTLTARVTSSSGTPTGQVEFFNSDDPIGTGTLSNGTATLTTNALAVGSHAITVRYLGSASHPPSLSATLVQVVNTSSVKKKTITLSTNASPSTGTFGNEATFTVTVAPPFLQSVPTGDVRFVIDGVSATVVSLTTSGRNGVATLSTSSLPRGTHRIACTYLGSGTYAGGTATITYIVN
jgi:hypothetical protein